MRARTQRARRGFTLLEVVISLAILAVSLTVLLTVQASSLNNAGRSRDVTIATLLARGKMIDIEKELFDEGFTSGETLDDDDFGEEGHPEIKWKSKITEIEINLDGLAGLCDGFAGDDGDDSEEGAGGCAGMLASFGGPVEAMLADVGNSLRLVELEVTWPVGHKYKESLKVTALVTREDLALKAKNTLQDAVRNAGVNPALLRGLDGTRTVGGRP